MPAIPPRIHPFMFLTPIVTPTFSDPRSRRPYHKGPLLSRAGGAAGAAGLEALPEARQRLASIAQGRDSGWLDSEVALGAVPAPPGWDRPGARPPTSSARACRA